MTTPPRFRQSYAKPLLTDCPAVLRRQMTAERKQSRAMEAGSLLDYLVFGQSDRFEVVDARYKSGPREGEPCTDWTGKEAREAREEIRARGLLPVLDSEVDALSETAMAIKARIIQIANDAAGPYDRTIIYQPTMQWSSELGVPCEGTPDVVVQVPMRDLIKVCTIDVKHTGFLQPKRLQRQVYDMGWDVQGAAYREGSVKWTEQEQGIAAFHMDHVMLLSSSIEIGMPPVARRLSSVYMEVGKRRWEKAQRIWQTCVENDAWPGYTEDEIEPTHFQVRTLEEYDETQFAETEEEP